MEAELRKVTKLYYTNKLACFVHRSAKLQEGKTTTGLFKMIVGVQFSSGNSAPNSGNNHHPTIPFEDGMHSFKRQGACVSRSWRYESEPQLKPSPLTCYKQFGTISIIVLMFVESQSVHIESTCKISKKKIAFLLNKKIHIPLSQAYCVRQVVKIPTIILNNPVLLWQNKEDHARFVKPRGYRFFKYARKHGCWCNSADIDYGKFHLLWILKHNV